MTRGTPHRHGERRTYLKGCRCPQCSTAHRRYMKRYQLQRVQGQPRRLDPTPAAAHVTRLRAEGWSSRQIAAAAGVSPRLVISLASGQYPTVRVDVAARLLGARPTLTSIRPRSYVDSTGTMRRIRALIALGHTVKDIAAAAGMSKNAINPVIHGERATTTAEHALAIERLYARWASVPGPSTRARLRAARLGWHSPIAWGEDIGDPTTAPETAASAPELNRDELAALRRAEIEHLEQFGLSEHDIADRLGMAYTTVRNIVLELRTGQRRIRPREGAAA